MNNAIVYIIGVHLTIAYHKDVYVGHKKRVVRHLNQLSVEISGNNKLKSEMN